MLNRLMLAAWLSLVAVFYATLIPFDFGDQSVARAWSHFTGLTFPQMSASARQQWVANVLLFLPLGLFWTAWLSGYVRSIWGHCLAALFVALLTLVTTATVEFLQFWLPRREPSLLDMSGNFTGGALGILAWYSLSGPGRRWLAILQLGGLKALWRGLTIYLVFYVLFAWLPLDFMLSWQEVVGKLHSGSWGLWRAPVSDDAGLRWWVLRSMSIAMTLPVGILLGWWLSNRSPGLTGFEGGVLGFGLGLIFALMVEGGQFLTISGVADGGSVFSRTLGVVLGVAVYLARGHFGANRVRHWARPLLVVLVVPYLGLMVLLNLGGKGFALEGGSVLAKLESVNFLPFWYHYMVPEAVAIGSVLLHLVMYFPVGGGVWLWRWAPRGVTPQDGLWAAVLLGLFLAFVMESGKLFMAGLRPDPTSLLIAALAGWVGWQAFGAVWWGLRGVQGRKAAKRGGPSSRHIQERSRDRSAVGTVGAYPGIQPADRGFVRDGVNPDGDQGD